MIRNEVVEDGLVIGVKRVGGIVRVLKKSIRRRERSFILCIRPRGWQILAVPSGTSEMIGG